MDDTPPKYRLHDSIGYFTTRAARLVERRVDGGLKEFDLTRTSWCILLAVAEENLHTPSEIAEFVGIDRTATSRALRGLEAQGLVDRTMGQQDRRMTKVAVTEKGRDQMIGAVPVCLENMDHFDAKLTNDERLELKRLLVKLVGGEGNATGG